MKDHDLDTPQGIHWSLSVSHPVLAFLAIAFGWSWVFWLAVMLAPGRDQPLVMCMTFLGAYGPAIGAILVAGLRNGLTFDMPARRWVAAGCFAIAIFAVLAVRYQVGDLGYYDQLPDNPGLSLGTVIVAVLVSLTGGWVFSSPCSKNQYVRTRMASLLPRSVSWFWLGAAVLFLPTLYLLSWGIGMLLGLGQSQPPLLEGSSTKAIGLFLLTFAMTALVRGGIEEPGWRGFMVPELQKRFSPLTAALIVALAWDVWHIPLHLNGFYPSGLVAGMLGRSMVIVPIAIFFSWFYNRAGGQILLLLLLHTSFDVTGGLVPTSLLPALSIALILVIFIVVKDKMYRRRAAV